MKTRYFKISRCSNPDYNSSDCSFISVLGNTAHAFSFGAGIHDLQVGKRYVTIDNIIHVTYFSSALKNLKFEHEIYFKYKTEREYLDDIEKYRMARELVS